MNLIEIKGLYKTLGPNFSLENVDLTIEEGKIFALLGLNGAGKTTLVKIILNLIHADKGIIKIRGLNAYDSLSRSGVVFVPEKFSFFSFYTVKGALDFFAEMKGLDQSEKEEQIGKAMNEFNITDLKNRKLKSLSKGQLQRVGLCNLIIGENSLLILDEPFSGLDPLGMKDLKAVLKKEREKGKTIFINSHILSEMEQICDEVAIIHQGRIRVKSSVMAIVNEYQTLENFFTSIVEKA